MLNIQCSMLNVQCSMFNAQCSMFNAQCSMLNAQCSILNAHAQCAMRNAQRCSMLNTSSHQNMIGRSGQKYLKKGKNIQSDQVYVGVPFFVFFWGEKVCCGEEKRTKLDILFER